MRRSCHCLSPKIIRHICVKQHCSNRFIEGSIHSFRFSVRLWSVRRCGLMLDAQGLEERSEFAFVFATIVSPGLFHPFVGLIFDELYEFGKVDSKSGRGLIGYREDEDIMRIVIKENEVIPRFAFRRDPWSTKVRMNSLQNFRSFLVGRSERTSGHFCSNTGFAICCII